MGERMTAAQKIALMERELKRLREEERLETSLLDIGQLITTYYDGNLPADGFTFRVRIQDGRAVCLVR